MLNNWSVTYANWTEDDVEHGDTRDRGFEWEANASLRDALETFFGGYHVSTWPYRGEIHANEISRCDRMLWFTRHEDADLQTGDRRELSLHIPAQITPSSRIRLARLLGLKVRA